MENNELKEKCNKIYQDNKEMFDLINKYKDDEVSIAAKEIRKYLNKLKNERLINYKENPNASTTLCFIPCSLNKYLPSLFSESNDIVQNKCLGLIYIYLDRKTLTCNISFYFNYTALINYKEIENSNKMTDKINEYLKSHGAKQELKYKGELYKNKQIGTFSFENQNKEYLIKELNDILTPYL